MTNLLVPFLIMTLISEIGLAAEIYVQPGNSIQTAVNNSSPGDIIVVKPGTYTENIIISKENLTLTSDSRNPEDTIIKAKNSSANVLLLRGSKIKIEGFTISGAIKYGYSGIHLYSCNNCTIENNKLVNNSFGTYLQSSKGNTLLKNTFFNNYRGVYLKYSTNNMISGNTAINNKEYGTALEGSLENRVSGNIVSNNERGIYFGTSDGNRLSDNIVQNNKVYGFSICGRCDKNLIYNNYFNNTNLTIKNGIGNSYNFTKTEDTNIIGGPYTGGNYWGKPDGKGFSQTAIDANKDGISDSAYKNITDSRYSDYLPLVDPKAEQKMPVTDFSSNITSGNPPLSVAFTDKSTNSPTSWKWSFGDGTYSTLMNPKHTYSAAGNYTVTLASTNEAGTGTKTKSSYIKVTQTIQKPVVSFWGSRTSGTAPLTISFTDDSINSPTSWKWDFGDGTYSTVRNPRHTYSTAGNYTITLSASNKAGSGARTRFNYIKITTGVQRPVVNFWGSRTSGYTPLNITFTDNSTNSPNAWKWSFGDGTHSSLKNPKHSYSAAGNYTVTLTASNGAGNVSKTRVNYIKVIKP